LPAAENLHKSGRERMQQKDLFDLLVSAQQGRFGDHQADMPGLV